LIRTLPQGKLTDTRTLCEQSDHASTRPARPRVAFSVRPRPIAPPRWLAAISRQAIPLPQRKAKTTRFVNSDPRGGSYSQKGVCKTRMSVKPAWSLVVLLKNWNVPGNQQQLLDLAHSICSLFSRRAESPMLLCARVSNYVDSQSISHAGFGSLLLSALVI
jgi:hypothetical protein